MVMIRAEVVRVNKSGSGGVIWSSAEEEGDLVRKGDADGSTTLLEEVDGGFSSLDGMLQWAIGISLFFMSFLFLFCFAFLFFFLYYSVFGGLGSSVENQFYLY